MNKRILKLITPFALALLVCLSFSTPSQASTKTVPKKGSSSYYYVSADMTGDGKSDSIKIITSKYKNSTIRTIKVLINNKTAYTKNISSGHTNYIRVKYAKMSNSREFLQIIGYGKKNSIDFNQVFRYNKSSKKLVSVSSFNQKPATAGEITSATGSYITISHSNQSNEVGTITWSFQYRYTNQKLVLVSPTTTTVKSVIGSYKKDKYTNLFKKNQFVAAKKLSFYNGSRFSYSVKAGQTITLKKLTFSNNTIYLQFQYGNKTGWAHVNRSNYRISSPWFYGVNSRLSK